MALIDIQLTDSEWMSIIDQEDENGLPYCCANVSSLRDVVIDMARTRGRHLNSLDIHRFFRAFYNAQQCIDSQANVYKIHCQLLEKDPTYKQKLEGLTELVIHQKEKEY